MWWWAGRRPQPLAAAPRGSSQLGHVLTGAAVVAALVLVLIGWMLLDAHRVVRLHTIRSAENLASAIAQDIARNLELYDLSLLAVVDGLRLPEIGTLSAEIRNYVLFDRAATAPHLGSIMVLDETGQARIDSRASTPPDANFAEQQFFRVHRDRTIAGLFISTPLKDSLTGGWQIVFSRRLEHMNGEFGGIVYGSLDLEFFKQLFASIDTGANGSIALFQADGAVLYRLPHDEKFVGGRLRPSGLFPIYTQAPSGSFELISGLDGVDRLYAYRHVGDRPLVLTVGIARSTAFAEWNRKALAATAAVLGLFAVIAILGFALIAELRRRGQVERAALESGRQYRLLAEHSADMIVRFDPGSQRRTYVSPSCRHLYGYEPEEALAISARDIIHPDDLDQVNQALSRLGDDGQANVTYRGRRKDGTYVWVEASVTPSRDPDTGTVEVVSVVRDISERVRYEAALRQAKDQADAANRAKSEFLGTMSHELRTPLNAVVGFTEILRNEIMGPIGNEQYRTYIANIHESSTHLLNLINEILDLSKAEAGKLELHEEIFDLAESIRSVLRLCGPRIDQAELRTAIDLPGDLPLLHGDERKTRQVLFNLLGNAVKFTPPGGCLDVAARYDPLVGLTVTITDSGIGIAPEHLDYIFEPFRQVDSSLSRNHPGSGLGLSVVKAIMDLHQGTVELKSTVGFGTAVIVVFPPERAVTDQPSQQPRTTAA